MHVLTRRFVRSARGFGRDAIHLCQDNVHSLAELHVLLLGAPTLSAAGELRVGPFADAFKIYSAHKLMIKRRG
jgi:hypothetical protein